MSRVKTTLRLLWRAVVGAGGLVVVAGCALVSRPAPVDYVPPVSYTPPIVDPDPHYTILVESNPPGAVIEFNGANMGTTPCRIRIPGKEGRKFEYKSDSNEFMAIPGSRGGYTQRKRFWGGHDIPERLHFDMGLRWN